MLGSPFDRGHQHGLAYKDDIIKYAQERVEIVMGGSWTGGTEVARKDVLEIAEAMVSAHEAYSPRMMAETRGIAKATGLSLGECLIVSGFTDFVDAVYAQFQPETAGLAIDDCTAFIVPDGVADGAGFFGQTWDMHDTATEFVIMLDVQGADAPKAMVFTTTGCVGQIGMNEHGIAVGINNLLGADGQIGVTWPFVVREVLAQDNIEDAVKCITEAPLAGAHNYLIFDALGNGFNIEAMSTRHHIMPLAETPIVHTNHCLVPQTLEVGQPRPFLLQRSSEARRDLGIELLSDGAITIETLQELTRQAPICTTSKPPWHVETCGAAIMRPKTREFWAVWGLPDQNEYERFEL